MTTTIAFIYSDTVFFLQVGKVKLCNKNTWKFINGLHLLIDDSFQKPEDEGKRDAWN